MRSAFFGAASVGLFLLATTSAGAAPITYTIQGIASGSLGATPFSGALVTISGVSDTTNVFTTNGSSSFNLLSSETVTVAGIGTAIVSTPGYFFFHSSGGITNQIGAADSSQNTLLAATLGFGTYDLRSAFGPVGGIETSGFSSSVPTSLGNFSITAIDLQAISPSATFTAQLTPEPATWMTMAIGLGVLVLPISGRRRRALRL